jgi:hypothetical protein
VIFNETASTRVDIMLLERDARDLLQKMSRLGVSVELLGLYEQLDTRILRLRMQLVEDLRTVLHDRSTSLYDKAP